MADLSMNMNSGTVVGVASSIFVVVMWVVTFHKKFVLSIFKTNKVTGYGIYVTFFEAATTHYWYLFSALVLPAWSQASRQQVLEQVEDKFVTLMTTTDSTRTSSSNDNNDNNTNDNKKKQVLITHSCRALFYYVIKSLLEHARATKGEARIKICLGAVHFGSFYRMLRGMEKSMNCKIDFYEIDLRQGDWVLDQDSIDEEELATCDLVMAQHIFGVPFAQSKLIELGRKHNIPVLEDCVQSGSMFGKYKGNASSDVVLYSGGLDKTPSCFGGGFGYFRDTQKGTWLYEKCALLHSQSPLDTWRARYMACFFQTLHLCIAKNACAFNSFVGLLAYVWLTERGNYIKWYAISLKIRQAKAITPFQHAESGFLKQPHVAHLRSMNHGLSKISQYKKIAQHEIRARDLLLNNIPKMYHAQLFPWLTPECVQNHKDNAGISEFTWVVSPPGQRMKFCEYLNEHYLITMVNTTWETHEFTKVSVGKRINENLVYLPNINEMNDSQTLYVAQVLTKYCQSASLEEEEDDEVMAKLPTVTKPIVTKTTSGGVASSSNNKVKTK
jgi:dTDP-4-amino-4,6-dideoxygalactose transaminase